MNSLTELKEKIAKTTKIAVEYFDGHTLKTDLGLFRLNGDIFYLDGEEMSAKQVNALLLAKDKQK